MRELLAGTPDVDAVFAASDLMADGALRMLRQAGRRVPADVAVIGFDDNAVAPFSDPPLTTVRQPIQELGRSLARQLLRLLNGEDIQSAYMLPTELVIRESA
jgi:DNA-binding LacI/PurR family transcriptional regulator